MRAAIVGGLCAGAFAVACAIGGNRFVTSHNEAYRHDQAQLEQHLSDVRICRMQLGIDHGELGFQRLMMACAAEVQANRPAHGEKRSELAQKAWNQCMGQMAECSRALTPTHPTDKGSR